FELDLEERLARLFRGRGRTYGSGQERLALALLLRRPGPLGLGFLSASLLGFALAPLGRPLLSALEHVAPVGCFAISVPRTSLSPAAPARRHDGRPAAQGGGVVEPFDTTRPNVARVRDYWLGGKDNSAADRELAEKMLAVHPVTAQMAPEDRQLLGRAVSYVAARGVR